MKRICAVVLACLAVLGWGGRLHAVIPTPTTYTVTSTADPGDGVCDSICTLREAITAANANAPATDTINFTIDSSSDTGCDVVSGVCTISPTTPLPEITDSVIIDGYSQSTASENTLPDDDDAVILIGLNGSGIATGADGLTISAGGSTVKGLAIGGFLSGGGFNGDGIVLKTAGGNTIQGNFIGTDPTGLSSLSNFCAGIRIVSGSTGNTVGGSVPAARNLISKTAGCGNGLVLSSDNNQVQGNFIGTNLHGTVANGNSGNGIYIDTASNNTIGGTSAGARNIVSGNGGAGLTISGNSTGNVIEGNFIGTDVTGMLDLTNTGAGVYISGAPGNTIGGTNAGAGNVISNSNNAGIYIQSPNASGNVVQGNFIGTDLNGTDASIGNATGIVIDNAPNNVIGGTVAGAGNLIAFNNSNGVAVLPNSTHNSILSNSIFSNNGLGIDLGNDGVTANDIDPNSGANDGQNFPVLTLAGLKSGNTTILGTLNSLASSTFHVEFFSNDSCDASGNGEGKTFLGSTDVATDSAGDGSFSVDLGFSIPDGTAVTATATNPTNSTSEFSACLSTSIPGTIQLSASTYSINENGGKATITVTRTGGSEGAVSIHVVTSDGTATAGMDYSATDSTVTFANGETTSKTVKIPITDDSLYEGSETVNVTLESLTGAFMGSPSSAVLTIVDDETCGNGVIDGAEECDDGNSLDADGCEADCTLPICGNSIVDPGEECDDGNAIFSDGCSETCTFNVTSTCGNGVIEGVEECDDGNKVNADGCESNCTLPICGNGIVDSGETCDDHNTIDGDGCPSTCGVTPAGTTGGTSGSGGCSLISR